MKEKDKIDEELGKLLKEQSYQETTNQWFTHRVLHKLPTKKDKTAIHMAWFFYIAAFIVCAAWWAWLLITTNLNVITVRDIIYFATAGVVTLILAFSPLVAMFRHE